jgi:hypothetical protein
MMFWSECRKVKKNGALKQGILKRAPVEALCQDGVV